MGRRKWYVWADPLDIFSYYETPEARRNTVLRDLDVQSFGWLIVVVAGLGFLTDAYDIFAVNSIIPMLEYVYDKTEKNISGGFKVPALNIVLLGGSMIGQVVFGIWADLVGRRKIYGLELIITITATICVAMSATGAENSMDIFGWLFFWRLVIGVGVGVEYPLSAVITSEFAPTQYRGRMLAVVFSTQSLGQTIAAVMAIICTAGAQGSIQSSIPLERIRAVDRIWRLIAGLGTIPAAMALFSRLRIPETARYYMEIEGNSMKAESSVREQFNLGPPKFLPAIEAGDNILPAVLARNQTFTERPAGPVNNLSNDHPGSKRPPTPSSASAIIHVRKERPPIPGNNSNDYADGSQPPVSIGSSNIPIGNGRPPIPADSLNSLAHGSRSPMPLSNRPSVPLSNFTNNHISIAPQMSPISPASHVPKRYRVADESPVQKLSLAEFGDYLWEQGGLFLLLGKSLSWFTMDFAFYGLSLSVHHIISSLRGHPELSDDYQRLIDNGTDSLLVVSLGAMIGSTIMIIFVNKSSRRSIQFWGFFRLGLAFFIIGASYNTWVSTQNWACFIISYTIIQALFNWGPNTTTFMIPAEIFPTRFRCTCHGISAASGKLGSILAQIFVSYVWFPDSGRVNYGPGLGAQLVDDSKAVGHVFEIFGIFMFLGALVTYALIPETAGSERDNSEHRWLKAWDRGTGWRSARWIEHWVHTKTRDLRLEDLHLRAAEMALARQQVFFEWFRRRFRR